MIKSAGEYTFKYHDSEICGLPTDIFFDPLIDTPFIHQPGFLSYKETQDFYQASLESYHTREYATVHDYTSSVGARVSVDGRYTHYITLPNVTYNKLDEILQQRVFPELNRSFNLNGKSLIRSEGWQTLGYGEGFFFLNHSDNCVPSSMSPRKSQHRFKWWSNTPHRKFTVLFYLNDQSNGYAPPGTYSGGDFTFNNIFKSGEIVRVSPKAGTLVAFPSNFMYCHEVHKITRGYRFAMVTWLDVV